MSILADYTAAGMAIVRRDALLFVSYRFRVLSQLATVFFSISLFYYLSRMVHVSSFSSSNEYFGYAVVGIAILDVIGASLAGLPPALRQELVAGTFERLVLSPAGAVASTVAMLAFPMLVALVSGTVALTFGIVAFGLPLHWSTVPFAVPVAVLAAVAFAPFAIVIGGAVLAIKQAGRVSGFIVSGLSLIGGFFFPVALLPWWIRWMSQVQPFTPSLNLLRHFLIGTPLVEAEWISVLKLAGFAGVLMPFAVWFLSVSVRWAQRRGTIIEY
ncbi:MAG TPA: ABC transporter permease [Gaiellaceae bacterium]|nr:ABC transporter permease [Gaiellaceae bacterium]